MTLIIVERFLDYIPIIMNQIMISIASVVGG